MAATPDRVVLSPNFNPFPVVGKTVIIHATRSGKSMNPSELEGTLNYMLTEGTVSSQWVIGRAGEKVRVVPDDQQAWHASEDNTRTRGIEVCQGVESDGFTDEQYEALAEICRGYMADLGVPPVRVFDSQTPGFVGHQDTKQGKRFGKSDPGGLFDWDRFIASLTDEKEPELSVQEEEELADRRALELLLRELDFSHGGMYRLVPKSRAGNLLTLELRASDRTPLALPVEIVVRE